MSFCEISDVRNEDKKFNNTADVTDKTITHRISRAEEVVKVDLSSIISESELDTIGSNSKALKSLAIYKAVELTLVIYYGAGRKIDELTDVNYYQSQYNKLLKKVISGEIPIKTEEEDYSPKDYPSLDSGANKKFYIRKGVPGFLPEGEDQYGATYVDDTVKN